MLFHDLFIDASLPRSVSQQNEQKTLVSLDGSDSWSPSGVRFVRHDIIGEGGETRSELLIRNTTIHDNGTFHCQAMNKAATVRSNFTLHVTGGHTREPKILQVRTEGTGTEKNPGSSSCPSSIQLRLQHFLIAAAVVFVILLAGLIAMTLLLIRMRRRRMAKKSRQVEKKSSLKLTCQPTSTQTSVAHKSPLSVSDLKRSVKVRTMQIITISLYSRISILRYSIVRFLSC